MGAAVVVGAIVVVEDSSVVGVISVVVGGTVVGEPALHSLVLQQFATQDWAEPLSLRAGHIKSHNSGTAQLLVKLELEAVVSDTVIHTKSVSVHSLMLCMAMQSCSFEAAHWKQFNGDGEGPDEINKLLEIGNKVGPCREKTCKEEGEMGRGWRVTMMTTLPISLYNIHFYVQWLSPLSKFPIPCIYIYQASFGKTCENRFLQMEWKFGHGREKPGMVCFLSGITCIIYYILIPGACKTNFFHGKCRDVFRLLKDQRFFIPNVRTHWMSWLLLMTHNECPEMNDKFRQYRSLFDKFIFSSVVNCITEGCKL